MLYFYHDTTPAIISTIATTLEQQLFDDAWDTDAISDVLAQYGTALCLAYGDEATGRVLVGYCLYSVVFDVAEILRIAIDPAHQGAGHGRALLTHIIDASAASGADRMILEVRADNKAARGLYRQLGFDVIDRRQGYYQTRSGAVDALVMMKGL